MLGKIVFELMEGIECTFPEPWWCAGTPLELAQHIKGRFTTLTATVDRLTKERDEARAAYERLGLFDSLHKVDALTITNARMRTALEKIVQWRDDFEGTPHQALNVLEVICADARAALAESQPKENA